MSRNKKDGVNMRIIHVMADGSIRESVAGVVIKNDEFYRVINGVLEKQKKVKS